MGMLPPLNSFFPPRYPKQQGKEKPLKAEEEPAALAGKATKVWLECSGNSFSTYSTQARLRIRCFPSAVLLGCCLEDQVQ